MPDGVRAKRPEHPDLGRGLVRRAEQAGVDTLVVLDALGGDRLAQARAQARVPDVGQVGEARTDRVGVRAEERRAAGQVEVVGDDHQRAGTVARVHAARGIGQDHGLRPQAAHQQDRLDDQPGVVAFVQVEPALEHRPPGRLRAAPGGAARRVPAPSRPASPAARRRGSRSGRSDRPPGRRGRSRGRCRPRARGPSGDAPPPRARPAGPAARRAGSAGTSRRHSPGESTCHPPPSSGWPDDPAGTRTRKSRGAKRPRLGSARPGEYRHRDAGHIPRAIQRRDGEITTPEREAPEATGRVGTPLM